MSKTAYESWSRAIALILKVVGVAGIVFVPVFWSITGKVELAFLPFFASLTTAGLGVDVLREIAEGKSRMQEFSEKEEG